MERQTTTADAGREIVAESDQFLDLAFEHFPPPDRDDRPVVLSGSALLGQLVKRFPDGGERNPHPLRRPNEREAAQGVPPVTALVPVVPDADDQPLALVEVQRGDGDPAAIGDLADGPFVKGRVTSGHRITLVLDLNRG